MRGRLAKPFNPPGSGDQAAKSEQVFIFLSIPSNGTASGAPAFSQRPGSFATPGVRIIPPARECTRKVAQMTDQDKKRREAEQHVTDELANQAKQEPGSAAEAESKEKRAQAEKEFQDAR